MSKIMYKFEDIEVTYEDTSSRTTIVQDKGIADFFYDKFLNIYKIKKEKQDKKNIHEKGGNNGE